MDINVQSQGEVSIISMVGHLDGSTAPQAQESIMPLITPCCKLVFDMSQCDYVSSAGLRLLLVAAKTLKSKSGSGVISGLLPEVKDVMEMTGFDKMFENYSSLDDAINAVKGS